MMTKTKIKLSKNTLGILKNFASINSNLLIKSGNLLKTIAPSKCLLAEAKVDEDFPVEIAIWDLGQFLGVVSLFNDPEFEFNDTYVSIQSNNSSVKYFYSAPSLLTVPTKNLTMPKVTQTFDLTQSAFAELSRAAAVLQVSDLEILGENGIISMIVSKKNDPSSNSYSVEVGETDQDFSYSLDMANLKLLQGDYTVSLTDSVVSKFAHSTMDLNYFIAVEKN
jgi:hypothetical protein